MPNVRWFQAQREALGNEAWLYSMLELAQAENALQWGFDETSINGVPTLNQWVLLHNGELAPKVVTIQCAGLMVGSTAQEICQHIETAWITGERGIDLLREELGDEADVLAPLTGGGVKLHKIRGVMHDTCNTANLTAVLMKEKRDTSGQLTYGYDTWESCPEEEKPWCNYLCGNHTRNLPIDDFNRQFDIYMKTDLGEALTRIQREGNGRSRVEGSGENFVRALCRLTHKGHAQYAKGDGHRFADWLQKKYNGEIKNRCAGRAEFASRQDW